MPVPPNYVKAVEQLGEVCGGDRTQLVCGASVVILTDGAFHLSDFDLVASNETVFREILHKNAFQDEKGRNGRDLRCMTAGCTQIIPIWAGNWSSAVSSTDAPTN